jgi:hypothetical protein
MVQLNINENNWLQRTVIVDTFFGRGGGTTTLGIVVDGTPTIVAVPATLVTMPPVPAAAAVAPLMIAPGGCGCIMG